MTSELKTRVVICRDDLPPNPNWGREHYPSPRCWDIIELFQKAAKEKDKKGILYRTARRLQWEFYWRYHHNYHRGRPLPKVYLCGPDGCVVFPFIKDKNRLVKFLYHELMSAAYTFGLIPKYRHILVE